jgi:hypothetical protein
MLALAERVRDTIHASPNMTRHAMTMAIISIGIACPGVREAVYAVAGTIGTVVVDHGKTGWVTPAIVPCVERAVARQKARLSGHLARKPRPSPPRDVAPGSRSRVASSRRDVGSREDCPARACGDARSFPARRR